MSYSITELGIIGSGVSGGAAAVLAKMMDKKLHVVTGRASHSLSKSFIIRGVDGALHELVEELGWEFVHPDTHTQLLYLLNQLIEHYGQDAFKVFESYTLVNKVVWDGRTRYMSFPPLYSELVVDGERRPTRFRAKRNIIPLFDGHIPIPTPRTHHARRRHDLLDDTPLMKSAHPIKRRLTAMAVDEAASEGATSGSATTPFAMDIPLGEDYNGVDAKNNPSIAKKRSMYDALVVHGNTLFNPCNLFYLAQIGLVLLLANRRIINPKDTETTLEQFLDGCPLLTKSFKEFYISYVGSGWGFSREKIKKSAAYYMLQYLVKGQDLGKAEWLEVGDGGMSGLVSKMLGFAETRPEVIEPLIGTVIEKRLSTGEIRYKVKKPDGSFVTGKTGKTRLFKTRPQTFSVIAIKDGETVTGYQVKKPNGEFVLNENGEREIFNQLPDLAGVRFIREQTIDGKTYYKYEKWDGSFVCDKEGKTRCYEKIILTGNAFEDARLLTHIHNPEVQKVREAFAKVEYEKTTLRVYLEVLDEKPKREAVVTTHILPNKLGGYNRVTKPWKCVQGDDRRWYRVVKEWVIAGVNDEPLNPAQNFDVHTHEFYHPIMNEHYTNAAKAIENYRHSAVAQECGVHFGGMIGYGPDSANSSLMNAFESMESAYGDAFKEGIGEEFYEKMRSADPELRLFKVAEPDPSEHSMAC